MRIVLDTNVLISGVFFGGTPGRILEAWRDGRVVPVLTPEIIEEYRRVGETLAARYGDMGLKPILDLLLSEGVFLVDQPLPGPVSRDPDDDKFLAAAVASGAPVVVSGDTDLLVLERFQDVRVLSPRDFEEEFLDQDR